MILDRFSVLISSRFIPYSRHFLNEFMLTGLNLNKRGSKRNFIGPSMKRSTSKSGYFFDFLDCFLLRFPANENFHEISDFFSQKWTKQKYAKTIQNFTKKLNETLAATKNGSKNLWNSPFWEVSIRSFIVQWVPDIWVNCKSFL